MKLGNQLKEFRIKAGYTQGQAVAKLKISQTYLSQLEGDKKEASPAMLKKICKLYKVPPIAVVWLSTTVDDVPKEKKKIFKHLKPAVDGLIAELLNAS